MCSSAVGMFNSPPGVTTSGLNRVDIHAELYLFCSFTFCVPGRPNRAHVSRSKLDVRFKLLLIITTAPTVAICSFRSLSALRSRLCQLLSHRSRTHLDNEEQHPSHARTHTHSHTLITLVLCFVSLGLTHSISLFIHHIISVHYLRVPTYFSGCHTHIFSFTAAHS